MESDSDIELVTVITCTTLALQLQRRKRKQRKNYHVNPYLQLRSTKGRFFKDVSNLIFVICDLKFNLKLN